MATRDWSPLLPEIAREIAQRYVAASELLAVVYLEDETHTTTRATAYVSRFPGGPCRVGCRNDTAWVTFTARSAAQLHFFLETQLHNTVLDDTMLFVREGGWQDALADLSGWRTNQRGADGTWTSAAPERAALTHTGIQKFYGLDEDEVILATLLKDIDAFLGM